MAEEVLEQPPLRGMRQIGVELSAVAVMAKAIERRRSTIAKPVQEKKPASTGKNRFGKKLAALTALGRLGGSLPKPEPLEPPPLHPATVAPAAATAVAEPATLPAS